MLRLLISEMLASYAEVFDTYGKPITPEKCRIYEADLADIPVAALRSAMVKARKTLDEFPKPAQIRNIAEEAMGTTDDAEAERALAALDKLVSEWGAERLPVFRGLDPKTGEPRWKRFPELEPRTQHAVNAVGGWKRYVSREEREAAFVRRDFLAAYRAYSAFAEPRLGLGAGSEDGRLLGAEIAKLAAGRAM